MIDLSDAMSHRHQEDAPKKAVPGDLLLVVHDFKARSSDELSLSKGDRIVLVERDDDFGDGWYLGRHQHTNETGLFPEVYTTTLPQPSSISNVTTSGSDGRPSATSQFLSPTAFANASPILQVSSPANESQVDERVTASSPPDPPKILTPPPGPPPPIPSTNSASEPSPPTPAPSGSATTPRQLSVDKLSHQINGQESPVMNETLTVINEHITDLSSPSRSLSAVDRQRAHDSESEYSSPMDRRASYITGNETDEEEENAVTEAEVLEWSPSQVAEYLRGAGVDQRHCQVFAEQEITGEVLLGLDQSSLLIKEFDLGPIGRRLRTWNIIKALQQDFKTASRASRIRTSQDGDSTTLHNSTSSRASAMGTVLPRIPSLTEGSSARQISRQHDQQHRPNPVLIGDVHSRKSSYVPSSQQNSPRRPSAASIREFNHSRRHSSIDLGPSLAPTSTSTSTYPSNSSLTPVTPHKKQASFDRNWTMSTAGLNINGRPSSASGEQSALSSPEQARAGDSLNVPSYGTKAANELDRGYFSGGEVEARRTRNVLRKREGAQHSRNSSYTDEQRPRTAASGFRHSRYGSADAVGTSASNQTAAAKLASPAAQVYYGMAPKNRFQRSNVNTPVSPVPPPKDLPSPTVTKLDTNSGVKTPTTPVIGGPQVGKFPPRMFRQGGNPALKSRATGSRTVSDVVTGSEKALIGSPVNSLPSPIKESPVQSPTLTTSSTPSGSKSMEIDFLEATKAPNLSSAAGTNVRRKSKKETSAYTRGLEKKTPQEQMIDCDYSGWMKKKSSNFMTTWKPRLFVLRGRRLSYYYSENDDQEKGLIDISSHRVLPADKDRITGFHAALTGASNSPTSPQSAQTPTSASTAAAAAQPASPSRVTSGDSFFIFKLVPPRSGLSRAVNFTKPTVHYFAVDNVQQGRLWMAALMKATIDRDESKPITTTYIQKTISLNKARQMRHRPPALMSVLDLPDDEDDGESSAAQKERLNKEAGANMEDNQSSDVGTPEEELNEIAQSATSA